MVVTEDSWRSRSPLLDFGAAGEVHSYYSCEQGEVEMWSNEWGGSFRIGQSPQEAIITMISNYTKYHDSSTLWTP